MSHPLETRNNALMGDKSTSVEELLAQKYDRLKAENDLLRAQLASLSLSGSTNPPRLVPLAPPVPAFHMPLPSPTAGGADQLMKDKHYWGLIGAPLSFSIPGVAQSFSAVLAAAMSSPPPSLPAVTLMEEEPFYPLAMSALPGNHIQVFPTQRSAHDLFGPGPLSLPRWTMCEGCKPELAVAAQGLGRVFPSQ